MDVLEHLWSAGRSLGLEDIFVLDRPQSFDGFR